MTARPDPAVDEAALERFTGWLIISRSIGWCILAILSSVIVLVMTYPQASRGLEAFGGPSLAAGIRLSLAALAAVLGARLGRLRGLGQASLAAIRAGLVRRLSQRIKDEAEGPDKADLERAANRVLVLELGLRPTEARSRLLRFLIPLLVRPLTASAAEDHDPLSKLEERLAAGLFGLMLGRTVTYLGLALLAAGVPAALGLMGR